MAGPNEYDGFADILNQESGIFDGEGLRSFDSAPSVLTQDGLAVAVQCRRCGQPRQVIVEYAELIALKHSVPPQVVYRGRQDVVQSPTQWFPNAGKNHGYWYPKLQCACGEAIVPLISPEEANAHVAKARRNGWISEQGYAQLDAMAQQAGIAMRQQMMAQQQRR